MGIVYVTAASRGVAIVDVGMATRLQTDYGLGLGQQTFGLCLFVTIGAKTYSPKTETRVISCQQGPNVRNASLRVSRTNC